MKFMQTKTKTAHPGSVFKPESTNDRMHPDEKQRKRIQIPEKEQKSTPRGSVLGTESADFLMHLD